MEDTRSPSKMGSGLWVSSLQVGNPTLYKAHLRLAASLGGSALLSCTIFLTTVGERSIIGEKDPSPQGKAMTISYTTQGVVTYMSPVEAFATTIKVFDRQKVCLIA